MIMRAMRCTMLAAMAAAGLSAAPVYAQFAAEEPVEASADEAGGAYADSGYDEGAYDVPDPAAYPDYAPAPPQSIGDRTIADVAAAVIGTKGARHAKDAETIVRTVIGTAGTKGGSPPSPGTDPAGLVQDILATVRKPKDPQ